MVSFKSIIIPYITLFFISLSVFADDVPNQPGKTDDANKPQSKFRGHATDGLIQEVLKLGDGFFDHYDFTIFYYADFLMKLENKDEYKHYIESKRLKKGEIDTSFREIQNGLKTTQKDELVDNIKKLSDILVEYKESSDEFYNKVHGTLKGDDLKNFEHTNKFHKSILLGRALDSFDNMIKVLNSIIPEKVSSAQMSEFEDFRVKIGALGRTVYNNKGDVNESYKEMLDKGVDATELFKKTIDNAIDVILEGGEKIDGNLISSIKELATTVIPQYSNAILPGLLAIAISSLIFIIF